jgi:hypothetical protein
MGCIICGKPRDVNTSLCKEHNERWKNTGGKSMADAGKFFVEERKRLKKEE